MGVKGKPLTVKEKEIIVKLKKYFDRTKGDQNEQINPSINKA